MTELEVAAFRRDCAALAGHVRAGLRGDGFGETARQALDKLMTLAYGAAGLGEDVPPLIDPKLREAREASDSRQWASPSEDESRRAREWLARYTGGPGEHRIEMGDTLAAYAREVVEPYRRTVANEVAALVVARARIEELEAEADKEAARWQEHISAVIIDAGLPLIDPSGNESGDPLDWTDDQVRAALAEMQDRVDSIREAATPFATCDGSCATCVQSGEPCAAHALYRQLNG